MNVLAVADTLERIGMDVAPEVVERARVEILRPPSTAQLYEVAHDIRVEASERDRPALPSAEEFVAEMPDEVREKWHATQAKWAGDLDRDVVAEDAEWQRVKTATLARLRMHGTCLGTDKPPVEVDGKFVCPVCRVEIVDPRKAGRGA